MERYINFQASINFATSNRLQKLVKGYMDEGVTKLHLLLSTYGGKIPAGINIYNFLVGLPIEVVSIHNSSYVDSSGIIVYCAGKERYASPYGSFLFHNPICNIKEAMSLELPKMREITNSLENDQHKIIKIIKSVTNCSEEEIEELMDKRKSLNTLQALDIGLVMKEKIELFPKGVIFDNILDDHLSPVDYEKIPVEYNSIENVGTSEYIRRMM